MVLLEQTFNIITNYSIIEVYNQVVTMLQICNFARFSCSSARLIATGADAVYNHIINHRTMICAQARNTF